MICPQCAADGKRSRVYPGVATVTRAWSQPYYDETGVYHDHDSNKTRQSFTCSEGHVWEEVSTPKCPAPGCSFGREAEDKP